MILERNENVFHRMRVSKNL